ncbi:MAG: chemotaxis protein CheW [Synechococcales bacterium]|nr:chemotaxis protein CheW [Synechococcales bacterium]
MQSLEEKSIIALARQGDAGAIALMLNYYFSAHQINTTVSWLGDNLSILLQGQQVPNQAQVLSPIQYVLKKLSLPNLAQARVYGQQQGQNQPAWQDTITYQSNYQSNYQSDRSKSVDPSAFRAWLNQGAVTPPPSLSIPLSPSSTDFQRFLRFNLVNRQTALIPLQQIREVIQIAPPDILPIPQMPDCVIGVCNHQGSVLWLIDCNLQMGLPSVLIEGSAPTLTVVVMQQESRSLGLVVPCVMGIETYGKAQILPPDKERFSPSLRPFLGGCLANSTSPILSVAALMKVPVGDADALA